MVYYKEVEIDEHLLFASEIAELSGIYSIYAKPHATMVKKILEKTRVQLSKEKIFYNTRNGLAQVYDMQTITCAINDIKKNSFYAVDKDTYTYTLNKINYTYVISKESIRGVDL